MRAGICLLVILSLAGGSGFLNGQALSEPEKNYEFMWKTLDANYALFAAKHIDWQAVYNIYRPLVNAQTTDDGLFSIMSRTLGHLNDNHVRLTSATPQRFFSTGFLYDYFGAEGLENFRAMMRVRPAPARYFKAPLTESANRIFARGWLAEGIGYIHFNAFDDAAGSAKAIDQILEEFKEAKALVVDVRRNGGGDDQIGKLLAGRFADRKRLYMTTMDRNGPRHTDYDPPRHFFAEPQGPRQFTKTVILLTNRLSISAAENFALAMRILPHVTLLGDFTSGCFADNYNVTLPNGWNVSLSKNLFLDYRGFCWEGIGVPPDLKMAGDYRTVLPENDPVLETAISLINSGKLKLQDAEEGTAATVSLAGLFEQDLDRDGEAKALANFNLRQQQAGHSEYYLDFYEFNRLGQKLFRAGRITGGETVFALLARLFPSMEEVDSQLAIEYLRLNRKKEALAAMERLAVQRDGRMLPFARQFNGYLTGRLLLQVLAGPAGDVRKEWEELQSRYPGHLQENLLNGLGYLLLGAAMPGEAITVFQFNTELFPRSANVYDSLGEAYMTAGDKEKAIINYEKSLQLNPRNPNAVEQLKKLKEDRR